jgi:hypothetical protein
MAKKDKKKKDKKGSDAADTVEAVRSAVERTFQATAEGAATTSKRTRTLVDEIAHAAARVRDSLEDVRSLRAEIEALARRVAALEVRSDAPSRPAPAKRRATAKRTAKAKPAKTRAKPRAKTARAKTARAKSARAKPSGS